MTRLGRATPRRSTGAEIVREQLRMLCNYDEPHSGGDIRNFYDRLRVMGRVDDLYAANPSVWLLELLTESPIWHL